VFPEGGGAAGGRKRRRKRKKKGGARHWSLIHVILAVWEAEIRRLMIQGQPREIVQWTHFQEYPEQSGVELCLKQ
jgi:hypothetical protein